MSDVPQGRGWVQRLADQFLPLVRESDPESQRILARSMLRAHLYAVLLAVALLAVSAWQRQWWSVYGMVAWLAVQLATPLLAQVISIAWACRLNLATLTVGALVGAMAETPITSNAYGPLLLVPFAAFTWFGRKAGLRWAAGVVTMAVLSRFVSASGVLVLPQPLSTPALMAVRGVCTFVVLIGFAANAQRNFEVLLERARLAVDAKGTFLANISHEIRTPLNGVMGMTEVMLMDEDRPRRKDQLEVIQRSGRHLLKIINELLDLTRAERGELTLEHTAFSLETMLRETLALYQPQAQLRGIELKLSLPLDVPPFVTGDDFRLRQMLGNLINNALKFTERGAVVVRLYRLNQVRWRFEVEDSGIGISNDALGKLFVPFKQADSGTARRFGGTGLGLALVRVLSRQMGGDARARSVMGSGSVFSIDVPLPIATAPEVHVPVAPTPSAIHTELPVLVVDDNPVNLRIAAALLTRAGCVVTQATNGADAIARAQETSFAAIFMDCQMPGIDGWEATRRLRASAQTAAVPIVALTASAMPHDVAACLEAGMNEVLAKPVTYEALKASLARYTPGALRKSA